MTILECRCLHLPGTVGAGKTTTAYAIGELLQERVCRTGDEREWHVRRAPQLEQLLDDADSADLTIDVGDDAPRTVAERVLAETGFVE